MRTPHRVLFYMFSTSTARNDLIIVRYIPPVSEFDVFCTINCDKIKPFKDEAQTALFKDPVRTAQ
jgi:hypothetical protein